MEGWRWRGGGRVRKWKTKWRRGMKKWRGDREVEEEVEKWEVGVGGEIVEEVGVERRRWVSEVVEEVVE